MNKFELTGTDTFVYHDVLPNGLNVYLIPYDNKNNYFMSYFTKFGSINLTFQNETDKKMITVPKGIAHFLEHKMFEQEDGNVPFEFYSKSGTGCNASTGFKATRYIVYGTNNLKENLKYLLKYLNSPYFTDENVEKEKGIIAEEIKMYDDNPEWILTEEVEKATFKVHPIRDDIAGYVDTIKDITKEDLYNCYNTFYQPSNMGLIVGGKFDPNEIMDLIRNDEYVNKKKKTRLPKNKEINEPLKVNTKEKELTFHNATSPKAGYTIKISIKDIKEENRYEYNIYVGMILNILFGSSSLFRENMMKSNLLNSLMLERMIVDDYLVITFWIESKEPKLLIKNIKEQFDNYVITEEEIERCKRVWISSEVIMTDNVEITVDNMVNDIIEYGKIVPEKIPIIRSMNMEKLKEIRETFDFENSSTVILLPEDKTTNH